MIYTPNQVEKLNAIAQKFRGECYNALVTLLNQPPYRNTGEGVNSVNVSVVPGDQNKTPEIKIDFADHLLFLDKRKLQWTKVPDMKKLMAWAETKSNNPDTIKKLAWSKAWDLKKNDNWKAKPWRKKSLSAVLKAMNEQIVAAYDKALDEDFQQAANV